MSLHCVTVYRGGGLRGNNSACSALTSLSVTFPTTHKLIGPFWCWFLGWWVYVCSRTLWVSPANSLVRLGVSPPTAIPISFYSQRLWDFISPCWNSGLLYLSCSPVVPPGLSAHKCGTAHSTSHRLTHLVPQLPTCCKSSLPRLPIFTLVPVWMNVSSLTPWLSNFHTIQFSDSSSYFLFLNLLLSFFWLCKEAKYIYLHFRLGWESPPLPELAFQRSSKWRVRMTCTRITWNAC